MLFSLNCLIAGQTSNNIFTKYIGEESEVDGVQVKFDQLSVAGFKKLLLRENQLKSITDMDLLKVELDLKSLKDKTYTKGEKLGTMMEPLYDLKEYFENNDEKPDKMPKEGHLHIYIVPTSTGKYLPMFYLSNKKFALSHILYFFFIRSGKRSLDYDWSEDQDRKKGKLSGAFIIFGKTKASIF